MRLGPSSQKPKTPVEELVLAVLQGDGPIRYRLLVERVADKLFEAELEQGGWALDVGLFGSSIFIRDVTTEIRAKDGTLWRIEKES